MELGVGWELTSWVWRPASPLAELRRKDSADVSSQVTAAGPVLPLNLQHLEETVFVQETLSAW